MGRRKDELEIRVQPGEESCDFVEPETMDTSTPGPSSKPEQDPEAEGSEEDEEFLDVEFVIDKRIRHGKIEYLLRWKGYGP